MDVPSPEPNSDTQTDRDPLLLDLMESQSDRGHIIDITGNDDASSSSSHNGQPSTMDLSQQDRPSSSTHAPTYQAPPSSSNRLHSRNSSFMRRGDGYGRRQRSPLNSRLWISVELVVTVSQIIASIIVLSLSRNENPQAPLFAWVVGYASGCVAMLPILCWRYHNCNRSNEHDSTQSREGSSENNPPELTSYTAISVTQALDEENHTSEIATRDNQVAGSLGSRYVHFCSFLHIVCSCLAFYLLKYITFQVSLW